MESLNAAKVMMLSISGLILSVAVQSLGGYDALREALLIFMAIDIVTGWMVAAVFKNSAKTESGRLASAATFRGLMKKGCMLLLIVIAVLLDSLMNTPALTRDAVIIAFVLNELVSILENTGLMGVKLPKAVSNALELLGKNRQA